MTLRLEALVEHADGCHLVRGGEAGRVVDHGNQVLHLGSSPVVWGRSSWAATHTCYEHLRPDPTLSPGFLSRTFWPAGSAWPLSPRTCAVVRRRVERRACAAPAPATPAGRRCRAGDRGPRPSRAARSSPRRPDPRRDSLAPARRRGDARCGERGTRADHRRLTGQDPRGRPPGGAGASVRRQDVEVELVSVGVGHPPPAETFQLTGPARLKPSAAECLRLPGGRVEVVNDQV